MKRLLLALLLLSGGQLGAQTVITQWDFDANADVDVPGGPDSPLPIAGFGVLQLIGGTTATFNSGVGSSDAVSTSPPNFGWHTIGYPASGLNSKTAGIVIKVSTKDFVSITLKFDQRLSNKAANTWVVFYTSDITASNLVWEEIQTFTFVPAPTDTGDKWYNGRTVDLSAIPAIENNANAAFKIVAAFDPIAGNYLSARSTSVYDGGTVRFDMITVSGVPAVIINNEKPEVSAVTVSGIVAVGDSLKATYAYSDAEGDLEGTSTYQWYRSDAGGANAVAIPDGDTLVYIPTIDDIGKYVFIEVTPVAASGTSPGEIASSDIKGPVLQLGDPGVLKINELYSRGEDVNEDPDLKADWIEFYNPGATAVTVAGLQICDSGQCQTLSLDAYSALIVPAGGFLALAEDDINSFTFGLSSLGEKIWLRRFNDAIIDSMTFPALEDTQSYGRHNDGALNIRKLIPPTRGMSNNTATPVEDPVTTGVEVFASSVQFFPIPVVTELTISAPADRPVQAILLFNALGQEMGQVVPQYSSTTISFGEMRSGLYIVRVLYKDGQQLTKKVIKN